MRVIGDTQKDGEVRAVASGTLSNGDAVIVNSDGTVSVVEETTISFNDGSKSQYNNNAADNRATFDSASNKVVIAFADKDLTNRGAVCIGTVSGNSISFGSTQYFSSVNSGYIVTTFDSNSNKVVIAYQDTSNSNYGTAVVGTVSGTSISFGSPVVFRSSNTQANSAIFDPSTNKVVIAFRDAGNSNRGSTVVGTVSGTSISFGSTQVFETNAAQNIRMTFDSSQNQIVFLYVNQGSSDTGTVKLGKVSGTSISFSGPNTISTNFQGPRGISFDSAENKVVIPYADGNNSSYGTVIVGSTGSLSISFGTPVVFESSSTQRIVSEFDPQMGKTVIVFNKNNGSGPVTALAGTISGTSITFSSPLLVDISAASERFTSTFDSNQNKMVVATVATGFPPTPGHAVVIQAPGAITNLTTENFIGFSKGGYTNTAVATIQTGGSINDAQSGLTPGQEYYVQANGTLTTTPDTPSVKAGLALSSNKLLIKR